MSKYTASRDAKELQDLRETLLEETEAVRVGIEPAGDMSMGSIYQVTLYYPVVVTEEEYPEGVVRFDTTTLYANV